MSIYEERQVAKRRAELYRAEAARRVGAQVHQYGNVAPMIDGAFVEVCIWVPLSAIEPKCPDGRHTWTSDREWDPEVGTPCDCGSRRWGANVVNDVELAREHHAVHGDMDGKTCLLSRCAIHYPSLI